MTTAKEIVLTAAAKRQVELQGRIETRKNNQRSINDLAALNHNIEVAKEMPDAAFSKTWGGSVDSYLYSIVKSTDKGKTPKDF